MIKQTISVPEKKLRSLISGPCTIQPSTDAKTALKQFHLRYPLNEQWRLLVDGIEYANFTSKTDENTIALEHDPAGWRQYENREPGSLAAFFSAWQYCLNEIDSHPERTPLTSQFILDLHKFVTENVSGNFEAISEEDKKFRNDSIEYYAFTAKERHRYTSEGFKSLLSFVNDKKNDAILLYPEMKPFVQYTADNSPLKPNDNAVILYMKKNLLFHTINIDASNLDVFPIVQKCKSMMDAFRNNYDGKSGYAFYMIRSNAIYKLHPVNNSNISADEILKRVRRDKCLYISSQAYITPQASPLPLKIESFIPKYPENFIANKISQIINDYNEKIAREKCDDDKLFVIGNTIQALERIHPFSDANGRTFVNLLLNYMLLKEGFPPATLFEPNVFDAYGYTVAVLKKGIANTLEIYRGNRALFEFHNDDPRLAEEMEMHIRRGRMWFLANKLETLCHRAETINNGSSTLFSSSRMMFDLKEEDDIIRLLNKNEIIEAIKQSDATRELYVRIYRALSSIKYNSQSPKLANAIDCIMENTQLAEKVKVSLRKKA